MANFGSCCSSILNISVSGQSSYEARIRIILLLKRGTETLQVAPPIGMLEDGRPYVRILYMPFSDDFTTMGGRGGSSGGVYIAPLVNPPSRSRGLHSVGVLGLTPPGVSSNNVMRGVIDDIVECSTRGIEISSAQGENIVVFIDLVAYIGD